MPNETPNQPLNQHPLPYLRRNILGQDAAILADIVEATEYLVVPPPTEAGVLREVGGDGGVKTVSLTNLSGVAITDAELVFKDGSGNEVLLSLITPIPDLTNESFGPPTSLFMEAGDLGVFLRFTGGDTKGVSVVSQWTDVRAGTRVVLPLSDSVQDVLPDADEGEVFYFALSPDESLPAVAIANFDSVDATAALTVVDPNNVEVPVPLAARPLVVPAGIYGTVFNGGGAPGGVYPKGWKLRVVLAAAPTDDAPVLYAVYQTGNQSPVRQDQGGAY
jgi:hypothetical protein